MLLREKLEVARNLSRVAAQRRAAQRTRGRMSKLAGTMRRWRSILTLLRACLAAARCYCSSCDCAEARSWRKAADPSSRWACVAPADTLGASTAGHWLSKQLGCDSLILALKAQHAYLRMVSRMVEVGYGA